MIVVEHTDLEFEPFRVETENVKSFDCGNKDLNDFLSTDEVETYEKEMLGKTTLVIHNGQLVAYYTISNSVLRKEYVKTYRSFSRAGEMRIDGIPAITIGRLAVDEKWQRKGIGKIIIQRIAMYALDSSKMTGVRLLLVQAKSGTVDFYKKLGFELVVETKSERKRFKAKGTRTMFSDLRYLRTIVD